MCNNAHSQIHMCGKPDTHTHKELTFCANYLLWVHQ